MKKMLLSFVVALVGTMGFTSQAEDLPTITFGYCADELKSVVGPRRMNSYVGAAMRIDAETAQVFAGDKITSMKIGLGTIVRQNAITFFISKDLNDAPIYTQDVASWSDSWKEFKLNTPYDITGETFYLGYYLKTLSDGDLPLAYDGNKANAQEGSAYYAGDNYSLNDMMKKWEPANADYGNACIRCVIEGEDLPEESMDIVDLLTTIDTTPLDTKFPVDIKVRNTGTKVVNSYEFQVEVGTQEPQIFKVEDVNIENYEEQIFRFEVEAKESGYKLPIVAKMVSANGNSLPLPSKADTYVMASNDLQPRVVVIEEATGTWCGWCPRGYVGMEEMRAKYGDAGNYIGIAVHSGDPMEVANYAKFISASIEGYPGALVNRMYTFDPSFNVLENYYNMMKEGKVEASISMDVDYANDERTKVNAEVTTTFVFDFEQASYGICLITLEDGLGPYAQSNYYGKNTAGGYLEGFSGQPDYVSLIYNEVPTYINNFSGGVASVPSKIKAGTPNVYKGSVVVDPKNLTNTSVVALLVNRESGHIITGCKYDLRKHAGVKDVMEGESVDVVARGGQIVVSNSNETTCVYGLNGAKAGEIHGNGSLTLEKGIYIVKVGEKVMKVAL